MKKHKSHARKTKDYVLKSKDRQGSHILFFVLAVIVAFVILSASTNLYPDADDVDAAYTGNVAGQAWGSVAKSHDGLIVEGWDSIKEQPSDQIVRFCSGTNCNYQFCQWGRVKVAGPGCLLFAFDISNTGCAYGITADGETISTEPSTIATVFSSGDAGARGLMNKMWKTDRGTYKCEGNNWVEKR